MRPDIHPNYQPVSSWTHYWLQIACQVQRKLLTKRLSGKMATLPIIRIAVRLIHIHSTLGVKNSTKQMVGVDPSTSTASTNKPLFYLQKIKSMNLFYFR